MLNKKIQQQFLEEFGENIKRIRIKKNLTQTDLALRINGDVTKIGRIERGEYNFGITSLLILAKAFEVDVLELLKIKNRKYYQKHIWESLIINKMQK